MFSKAVVLASLAASVALCQQQTPLQPASLVVPAQGKQVITHELSEFVRQLMAENNVPGLALGVVHSNGTVELEAFGRKTEDGDPVTVDTLFDIASCSKAFLASAVGILIEDYAQGKNQTPLPHGVPKLDWYTKLADLLPDDWQLMDEWASEKATLRDILSHQSGLPRHEMSYHADDKPIDVIRRMRYLRPSFELRQRWHYNNQFYMTGAHIVSTYSGQPYTEFVKERIWDPLNMSSSTFSPNEAASEGKLTQTWARNGRRIPFWFTEDTKELNAGPGGVISSVVDLTKWLRTLLNAGIDPSTNNTILPRTTYDMITRSHAVVSPRPSQSWFSVNTYGMGWFINSYQGHNLWTHSGSIPGISAEVFFLPDSGLGIVALSNGDAKHQQELAICYRIIEDFLGLERKESERLVKAAIEDEASHEDRPEHIDAPAPLSLPLEQYTGPYYDPGYGNITLCAPSPHPSEACAPVLKTWSFFENTTDATWPVLYAAMPSVWISHLRLVHKDGDKFGVAGTYLFPKGYGNDKSPFSSDEDGEVVVAEFLIKPDGTVKGVALNGFVGETTELQRIGGTIEQTAEIWLTKL